MANMITASNGVTHGPDQWNVDGDRKAATETSSAQTGKNRMMTFTFGRFPST